MIKLKLQQRKIRRQTLVWFALAGNMTFAGTVAALTADLPVPALEASPPMAIGTPENINPISVDNPIGAILISKRHPMLRRNDFSRESDLTDQIYLDSNFQPIWFSSHRSQKNLADVLSILNNAAKDGLTPVNYDVGLLKELINKPNPDANETAAYDVAITVSLLRFLHDLRQGQIDPRDIQYPVHIASKPPLDIANLLRQHLSSESLIDLVAQFEPKAKQYQQLKHILHRMQPFAIPAGLQEFKPDKLLRPGAKHRQVVILREYLNAMGLMQQSNQPESQSYDNELVAAIEKIQKERGLKADGIIGPSTVALFKMSSNEKIAQIELAMERARWIPDADGGPMILVNIPAFELWAFNSADDANPLNMKVIVGKSPGNQTPVLWEEMKYLEFMPYWNIPKTIFEKEIRPKWASNQSYLASHDIELVRHQNSDAQGGGSYIRARQRPGKKNPLGRVKFVFPNAADVYLHDTPARTAFSRPRRDLSHGCVRVSEPERLAEFVLSNQEGWDKENIRQAMSAAKTRHVTLKRSVPVLFYYATTFVDHENQLRFYPDVYGQDEALKKALQKAQMPALAYTASNKLAASKSPEVATNP